MKRYKSNLIAIILSTLAFLLTLEIAKAQNLPKVQETSVHAPSDIKIDGKLSEWSNGLQAYNPASRISYIISNNEEKLYLTVFTNDLHAIAKINKVGINFTVSHSEKKSNNEKAKDINNITILHPVKTSKISGKGIQPAILEDAVYSAYLRYKIDTTLYRTQLDSLINIANTEINLNYKGIQVTGISEITDTPLSIYNLTGIQSAAGFNDKMAYIYELAIPLKYLKLSDQKSFSYNIKLSEPNKVSANGMPAPTIASPDHNYLYEQSTTDFWGEYTLIN